MSTRRELSNSDFDIFEDSLMLYNRNVISVPRPCRVLRSWSWCGALMIRDHSMPEVQLVRDAHVKYVVILGPFSCEAE
jgi:hypothetical protein